MRIMKTTIKILLAFTMIIAVSCNKDEENNDVSKKYSMTILTGMTAGHDIYLYIDALIPDREGIWIDLNNNGKKTTVKTMLNLVKENAMKLVLQPLLSTVKSQYLTVRETLSLNR
jgi:hypothetical protein